MSELRKLLFRSCEASDGRRFAFLTEQPEIEELFDSGYKVAYKSIDGSQNSELLANWRTAFTVTSDEVNLLEENNEIPEVVQSAFNALASALLKGIDVFFCDYNFGVIGDLPMCNAIMEQHKSTDFVLFSCNEIVGDDPTTQPYMVSYAMPRYETGQKIAQQHRIYCRTSAFAFCEAINAIITQRTRDNHSGGHIRSDVDTYIAEPIAEESTAKRELDRFANVLRQLETGQLALPNKQTD